MKQSRLRPAFVEFIPESLEEGVLYVAMEYRTTAHQCCCGCGSPVYLPLSPAQWRLTFDGESIWMAPSIGSWSLPCRSHYWIRGNCVQWAEQWTDDRVMAARAHSLESSNCQSTRPIPARGVEATQNPPLKSPALSFWARLKAWVGLKA